MIRSLPLVIALALLLIACGDPTESAIQDESASQVEPAIQDGPAIQEGAASQVEFPAIAEEPVVPELEAMRAMQAAYDARPVDQLLSAARVPTDFDERFRALDSLARLHPEALLPILDADGQNLKLDASTAISVHWSEPIERHLAKRLAEGVLDPALAEVYTMMAQDRAALLAHIEAGRLDDHLAWGLTCRAMDDADAELLTIALARIDRAAMTDDQQLFFARALSTSMIEADAIARTRAMAATLDPATREALLVHAKALLPQMLAEAMPGWRALLAESDGAAATP